MNGAGPKDNGKHPVPRPLPIRQAARIILVGWALLLCSSLAWNISQVQKMILHLATIEAEASINKDMLYRRWVAKQGGVYVVPSDQTPPNPHLGFLPNRDLTTTNGLHLTLVNPAYMTRQVHELATEQYGVQGHITSLNPLRPENQPDPWELHALTAFSRGASEVMSLATIDEKPFLRLIRPFITEEPCLKCHAAQGYNKGDIRGGISVSVPMTEYYRLRQKRFLELGFWHLIIFLAGGAALLRGSRRLQALADKNAVIQEELVAQKETLSRFRALIDQSNDSLFIIDPESGRILDANATASLNLGYEREQLLRLSVMDVDPLIPDKTLWQAHCREMQSSRQMTITSHHRRIDGAVVPVEITIRYLVFPESDYIVATARDISERRQKEEELEQYRNQLETMVAARTEELQKKTADLEKSQQAMLYLIEDINETQHDLEVANQKLTELDRLKSMFIASMSHELRTPLNSIIGFSSILLDEWIGPLNEEQKANQAIILKNGKHLLSLINDIIDISKIEAGMVESIDEEFDLAELTNEAAANFTEEVRRKGVTLTIEPCPCVMNTDRRRLLQCLINVIGNAVKFTDQGGITLHADYLDDGKVALAVSDTGIGISGEDQARLFTPFVRLCPANGKYPGTGLGLYLSRKLVREILGGDLTVTSVPGYGSTFLITIPMRRSADAGDEP